MRCVRLAQVAVLLVACACSKKPGKPVAAGVAPSMDAVVASWKDAKLSPSEFAPTDGSHLAGGKCRAGTVSGLETTLCEYGDEAAARAAEAAGLAAVGDSTGTALAKGKVLLVVADRHNADPDGKLLNQIAKTFRQK